METTDRVINPYTDKGTHLELPIQTEIPQGERVEIAKDKAEMTFKGWNDEYAIKIIPQIPTPLLGATRADFQVEADRQALSKKVEYKQGDVTAFIEPKDSSTTEFDIDFILDSKPDTNVFTYVIEGAENFEFAYQPALTDEDIKKGMIRPENVVGSYAVYHKTKLNHRVGETNYATGKVFHIYRPKATDANGNEIWAELYYENGVLSVTVNEKWLSEAIYPVVVDPTFGNTSAGASSTQIDGDQGAGSKFTLSENGTGESMSMYGRWTGNSAALHRGNIWNSSFQPFTNGLTAGSTFSSSNSWSTLNFSTGPTLTTGDYWLGVLDSSDSGSTIIMYDAVGNDWRWDFSNNYNTPTQLDAGDQNNALRMSVYVTYNTGGGGGVVKTINGLAYASVKTLNGLAVASVKTKNGIATQ